MRGFLLFAGAMLLLGLTANTCPAAPSPDSGSPLTAATVGDFLAACAKDQFGCANRVGDALIAGSGGTSNVHLCISSDNYTDAVPQWLSTHPETAARTTNDGIMLALKTLYHC